MSNVKLRDSEPKARNVTLQDVARIAGVSKMTVSRVLNGQQKNSPHEQVIFDAVRTLNFEVNPHARRLSTGRDTGSIGLFATDLDLGVGTLTLRQIQSLLTHEGYRVPLYSTGAPEYASDETSANLMRDLRLQRPEAIVSTLHCGQPVLGQLERFQQEGGTVVLYGSSPGAPLNCDQILFDTEDNTYQAARHLLELGHRKLGFYKDGSEPVKDTLRYNGFLRALREFGGETRAEWLLNGGDFDSGRLQEGGGLYLAERFLKWKQRPTAMCIVNDNSAVAFIGAIRRAGIRVPEDLSVVGHDDLPIASVFPVALTTVSNPVKNIAKGVLEMILRRRVNSSDKTVRELVVKGELKIRESAIHFRP